MSFCQQSNQLKVYSWTLKVKHLENYYSGHQHGLLKCDTSLIDKGLHLVL